MAREQRGPEFTFSLNMHLVENCLIELVSFHVTFVNSHVSIICSFKYDLLTVGKHASINILLQISKVCMYYGLYTIKKAMPSMCSGLS